MSAPNDQQQTTTDTASSMATAAASSSANTANRVEVAAVAVVQEEVFSPPTTEQLNMRCTGVKRLLREAVELRVPNEMFCARPLEDNLFEWHFTVRGPPDTVYSDGIYHGRIVLPADYPMKPPNLILMTPNGRFETNKKICLSISGYHPETWLPSWSIRTALLALIGFMPTHSAGALGSLECSQEVRRQLALKSLDWRCPQCNVCMREALPPPGNTKNTEQLMVEVKNAIVPSASSPTMGKGTDNAESTSNGAASGSSIVPKVPTTPAQPSNTAPTRSGQNSENPPPAANRVTNASRSLLENPLLWMSILFMLFLALLFRRLLLNYQQHNLQPHQAR